MRTHPARTCAPAFAAICALLMIAALLSWPAAAHAQDGWPKDAPVSWSVRTATAAGPDGRSWVELEADPGAVVHQYLAVQNLGEVDATFRITAKDGYYTSSGRFNMLESAEQNTGAGLWVDVAARVKVAAGQTVVVPYSITVPDNATPGDHAAGLAASVISNGTTEGGDQLHVESRMGFKILLRTTGELAPSAVIEDVAAAYSMSWNPFSPGSMDVQYTVRNSGNTRLQLADAVTAAGAIGSGVPHSAGMELLPGQVHQVNVRLDDVWPVFVAPVAVELDAQVPAAADNPEAVMPAPETLRVDVLVPAIPWAQLLLAAGTLLLAAGRVRGHRKRRAEVARLIADARREGERSVRV
ncbi:COG1470 family protein [Arthrobacter sp. HLT1-20]